MSEHTPISSHDTEFIAPETSTELPETVEEKVIEAYGNATIFENKTTQEKRNEPFRVAFTDIDNTFFRPDRQSASEALFNEATSNEYPIIAVTGVGIPRTIERINEGELPPFQIIAGSTGTEIVVLNKIDGKLVYKRDEAYQSSLKDSYDKPDVAVRTKEVLLKFKEDQDLNLIYAKHEPNQQTLESSPAKIDPHKISFNFHAHAEELKPFIEEFSKNFPGESIVVSEDINSHPAPNERQRYNLDVVAATKAVAVNYLIDLLGVQEGIIAGDTGNDLDMLIDVPKLTAVVVGGARNEVVRKIDQVTNDRQRGSFRTIQNEHGETKYAYVEKRKDTLGPESIARAASILLRADRMSKLKKPQENINP